MFWDNFFQISQKYASKGLKKLLTEVSYNIYVVYMYANFEDLYKKWIRQVMEWCMEILHDEEDAKEVMSDSIMKFHKELVKEARGERDRIGSHFCFLKKLTKRRCYNKIKKRGVPIKTIKERKSYLNLIYEGNPEKKNKIKNKINQMAKYYSDIDNVDHSPEESFFHNYDKYEKIKTIFPLLSDKDDEELEKLEELIYLDYNKYEKTKAIFPLLSDKDDNELRKICYLYYLEYKYYEERAKRYYNHDEFHNLNIKFVTELLEKNPEDENDIKYVNDRWESRNIYIMKFYDNMKLREIAAKKGCSKENISKKTRKMKTKLEAFMENYDNEKK